MSQLTFGFDDLEPNEPMNKQPEQPEQPAQYAESDSVLPATCLLYTSDAADE